MGAQRGELSSFSRVLSWALNLSWACMQLFWLGDVMVILIDYVLVVLSALCCRDVPFDIGAVEALVLVLWNLHRPRSLSEQ